MADLTEHHIDQVKYLPIASFGLTHDDRLSCLSPETDWKNPDSRIEDVEIYEQSLYITLNNKTVIKYNLTDLLSSHPSIDGEASTIPSSSVTSTYLHLDSNRPVITSAGVSLVEGDGIPISICDMNEEIRDYLEEGDSWNQMKVIGKGEYGSVFVLATSYRRDQEYDSFIFYGRLDELDDGTEVFNIKNFSFNDIQLKSSKASVSFIYNPTLQLIIAYCNEFNGTLVTSLSSLNSFKHPFDVQESDDWKKLVIEPNIKAQSTNLDDLPVIKKIVTNSKSQWPTESYPNGFERPLEGDDGERFTGPTDLFIILQNDDVLSVRAADYHSDLSANLIEYPRKQKSNSNTSPIDSLQQISPSTQAVVSIKDSIQIQPMALDLSKKKKIDFSRNISDRRNSQDSTLRQTLKQGDLSSFEARPEAAPRIARAATYTLIKSTDSKNEFSCYLRKVDRSTVQYINSGLYWTENKIRKLTTTTRTSRLSELMNRVKLLRGEIDRAFETHEDNAIFIEEAKDRCTLEKSKFNQTNKIVLSLPPHILASRTSPNDDLFDQQLIRCSPLADRELSDKRAELVELQNRLKISLNQGSCALKSYYWRVSRLLTQQESIYSSSNRLADPKLQPYDKDIIITLLHSSRENLKQAMRNQSVSWPHIDYQNTMEVMAFDLTISKAKEQQYLETVRQLRGSKWTPSNSSAINYPKLPHFNHVVQHVSDHSHEKEVHRRYCDELVQVNSLLEAMRENWIALGEKMDGRLNRL